MPGEIKVGSIYTYRIPSFPSTPAKMGCFIIMREDGVGVPRRSEDFEDNWGNDDRIFIVRFLTGNNSLGYMWARRLVEGGHYTLLGA